jgi:hypothetical protein
MKDENMAASAGHARRYLFVIKNVQFLYSHFWRIAEAIQAAGWEVWVVADCNVDPQRVLDAGMRIVPVPAPGGFWNVAGELRALYLRYRAMRRIRPDIAHFVTLKVALPCGILARLAGVPSVLIAVTGSLCLGKGMLFWQWKTRMTRDTLSSVEWCGRIAPLSYREQVSIFLRSHRRSGLARLRSYYVRLD